MNRSYNFTTLDYFVGAIESTMLCQQATFFGSRENIRRVISEIQLALMHKQMRKWSSRIHQCQRILH